MTVKGSFYAHIKGLSRGVILSHEYRGRTLGFDCSMLTHRFMLRDPAAYLLQGDNSGIVSAHVHYALQLIEVGIDPIFVLDGWPCPSKAGEDAHRTAARDAAMREYLTAEEDEGEQLLKKALSQTWDLKRAIIEGFRQHGVRYIVAPYEADSQLAWMAKKGLIYAVVGDDGDFLCMGCPRVVRKVNMYSRTATEYSLHRLTGLEDADPLLELAQVAGVEPTFQAFSGLVGNDYSNFRGVGYATGLLVINLVLFRKINHIARLTSF